MTQRGELPVAGKSYGLGMSMSVAACILLLLTLIALGVYSTQRIVEMAEVKKEGKLKVAVVEQELQQGLQETLEDLSPAVDANETKQLLEELEEEMDVDALSVASQKIHKNATQIRISKDGEYILSNAGDKIIEKSDLGEVLGELDKELPVIIRCDGVVSMQAYAHLTGVLNELEFFKHSLVIDRSK